MDVGRFYPPQLSPFGFTFPSPLSATTPWIKQMSGAYAPLGHAWEHARHPQHLRSAAGGQSGQAVGMEPVDSSATVLWSRRYALGFFATVPNATHIFQKKTAQLKKMHLGQIMPGHYAVDDVRLAKTVFCKTFLLVRPVSVLCVLTPLQITSLNSTAG